MIEETLVDTPFVGHLEPQKWVFLAIFERPGATRDTSKDERTVSLTLAQTLLRQYTFRYKGIPCPNTDRALRYWPRTPTPNKKPDR